MPAEIIKEMIAIKDTSMVTNEQIAIMGQD